MFLIVAVTLAHAAPQNVDDGRYYPTDEGRYYPDNSGAYVPDSSNDGRYYPDNSGAYTEDPRVYDRLSSGGFSSASNAGNVFASRSGQRVASPGPFAGSGVVSSAAPAPVAAFVPAAPAPQPYNQNRFYRILKQDQQIGEDGYFWV